METQIIREKQDLTYLSWSKIRHSSGTAGSFLKAYSELERSGYCYSVQGRGNFVSEDTAELIAEKSSELLDRMTAIRNEAASAGLDADALWKEASERTHK